MFHLSIDAFLKYKIRINHCSYFMSMVFVILLHCTLDYHNHCNTYSSFQEISTDFMPEDQIAYLGELHHIWLGEMDRANHHPRPNQALKHHQVSKTARSETFLLILITYFNNILIREIKGLWFCMKEIYRQKHQNSNSIFSLLLLKL